MQYFFFLQFTQNPSNVELNSVWAPGRSRYTQTSWICLRTVCTTQRRQWLREWTIEGMCRTRSTRVPNERLCADQERNLMYMTARRTTTSSTMITRSSSLFVITLKLHSHTSTIAEVPSRTKLEVFHRNAKPVVRTHVISVELPSFQWTDFYQMSLLAQLSIVSVTNVAHKMRMWHRMWHI